MFLEDLPEDEAMVVFLDVDVSKNLEIIKPVRQSSENELGKPLLRPMFNYRLVKMF